MRLTKILCYEALCISKLNNFDIGKSYNVEIYQSLDDHKCYIAIVETDYMMKYSFEYNDDFLKLFITPSEYREQQINSILEN